MRTTLDFDDDLLKRAKVQAAAEGVSLTKLIERAVRAFLQPKRSDHKKFRLQLLTKKGRALPGVNWDDRDSLYERMEDRE